MAPPKSSEGQPTWPHETPKTAERAPQITTKGLQEASSSLSPLLFPIPKPRHSTGHPTHVTSTPQPAQDDPKLQLRGFYASQNEAIHLGIASTWVLTGMRE
eukprot:7319790-Pyramimonas_sp.AAC.1